MCTRIVNGTGELTHINQPEYVCEQCTAMNRAAVCSPEFVHALRERRATEWVLHNVVPTPTHCEMETINDMISRWEYITRQYDEELFRIHIRSKSGGHTFTQTFHATL